MADENKNQVEETTEEIEETKEKKAENKEPEKKYSDEQVDEIIKEKKLGKEVKLSCAIGDDKVDGLPYQKIVDIARGYIQAVGGFEKFAEWGLIK